MHGASKNICSALWMFIFSPKILVMGKRNKGHISPCLHRTPPSFYTTFTYAHKLSLGPLKVCMPMTHSRVTVTVFQAKALYGWWTSEYAHYGHRIYSRGDHTVSSWRYISVFFWWHWQTLYLMCAPYFVDDTYGHCIWSESMIWSLDFRISSSRSAHTFCGANQPMVWWLRG